MFLRNQPCCGFFQSVFASDFSFAMNMIQQHTISIKSAIFLIEQKAIAFALMMIKEDLRTWQSEST